MACPEIVGYLFKHSSSNIEYNYCNVPLPLSLLISVLCCAVLCCAAQSKSEQRRLNKTIALGLQIVMN